MVVGEEAYSPGLGGAFQVLFPGTGLCFWELQELGGPGSRDRLARTSQNEWGLAEWLLCPPDPVTSSSQKHKSTLNPTDLAPGREGNLVLDTPSYLLAGLCRVVASRHLHRWTRDPIGPWPTLAKRSSCPLPNRLCPW